MMIEFDTLLEENRQTMASLSELKASVLQAVETITTTIKQGGTVYICGNGGSASDSQHFASEFTGRFEKDRRAYAAVALTTDTSALTAIGNDYGFEQIFARQVQALGRPGDCLIVISTSGGSKNLCAAVAMGKKQGLISIGLLGRTGGVLADQVDIPIIVPAQRTSRIQEAHIFILHAFCEAFEPK